MAAGEEKRRVPLGSDEPEGWAEAPDSPRETLGPEQPEKQTKQRRFPLNTVGHDSGNSPSNPGNNILPVPGNRGVTR